MPSTLHATGRTRSEALLPSKLPRDQESRDGRSASQPLSRDINQAFEPGWDLAKVHRRNNAQRGRKMTGAGRQPAAHDPANVPQRRNAQRARGNEGRSRKYAPEVELQVTRGIDAQRQRSKTTAVARQPEGLEKADNRQRSRTVNPAKAFDEAALSHFKEQYRQRTTAAGVKLPRLPFDSVHDFDAVAAERADQHPDALNILQVPKPAHVANYRQNSRFVEHFDDVQEPQRAKFEFAEPFVDQPVDPNYVESPKKKRQHSRALAALEGNRPDANIFAQYSDLPPAVVDALPRLRQEEASGAAEANRRAAARALEKGRRERARQLDGVDRQDRRHRAKDSARQGAEGQRRDAAGSKKPQRGCGSWFGSLFG